VENGDLNWILPGKLLAFSGPAVRPTDYVGFRAMVPEDYWEYYKKTGISAIVRLNKKVRGREAGGWGGAVYAFVVGR
jgi:cell division cycle 14